MKKLILTTAIVAPLLAVITGCSNQHTTLSHEDSVQIYNKMAQASQPLAPRIARPLKTAYVNACHAEYIKRFKTGDIIKGPITTSTAFSKDGKDPVGQGMPFSTWFAMCSGTNGFTHLTVLPGIYIDPTGYHLGTDVENYIRNGKRKQPDGSEINVLGSITYFLRGENRVTTITGVTSARALSGVDDFNLGDLQP